MSNITAAFRDLRKHGYFAKQNHECCQTCGWAAVPEDKSNKVVFYHAQDAQDLKSRGSCYLAWAGNGKEIVDILKAHNLKVEWDGTNDERIKIAL